MTTPVPSVTENSEFSLSEQSEGLRLVVAPARCETGKVLIREWAMEVNVMALAGKHDDCLDLMFSRKRKYDVHRKECLACTEFDLAKFSYRFKVTEKK